MNPLMMNPMMMMNPLMMMGLGGMPMMTPTPGVVPGMPGMGMFNSMPGRFGRDLLGRGQCEGSSTVPRADANRLRWTGRCWLKVSLPQQVHLERHLADLAVSRIVLQTRQLCHPCRLVFRSSLDLDKKDSTSTAV